MEGEVVMPTGIYQRKTLRERFESQYVPEPMSGCFIWLGALTGNGYGIIERGAPQRGGVRA